MTRAEKKERWNDQQRRPNQVRASRNGLKGLRRRKFIEAHRDDSCWICGKPIERGLGQRHPMKATIDHVKPLSRGGGNDPQNLRMAHYRCNRAKGNLTLREFKDAMREARGRACPEPR